MSSLYERRKRDGKKRSVSEERSDAAEQMVLDVL